MATPYLLYTTTPLYLPTSSLSFQTRGLSGIPSELTYILCRYPTPYPQHLWNRLEDVGPAGAPRLALLLPSLGCMRPEGAPGSRGSDARVQALTDLCLAGMSTEDYGIDQLSDAIMGLTLLGVVLSSQWIERFLEVGAPVGARGKVRGAGCAGKGARGRGHGAGATGQAARDRSVILLLSSCESSRSSTSVLKCPLYVVCS